MELEKKPTTMDDPNDGMAVVDNRLEFVRALARLFARRDADRASMGEPLPRGRTSVSSART